MGQYKVPQDVEAEDKIIGPLTLKQFIYAIIGVAWGGISWTLFKTVPVVFVLVGVPPSLLFLLLGLYRRQDQPFEAYFLALLNYVGKPRRRVWEKEPIAEVFKVEAPIVKAEQAARDPREVIGQLDRLAQIVDTRGYSAKLPEVQEPTTDFAVSTSDRLTQPMPPSLPVSSPADIQLSDDMLDFNHNPTAQNVNALVVDRSQAIRDQAIQNMYQQPATTSPITPAPTAPSVPASLPQNPTSQPTPSPITAAASEQRIANSGPAASDPLVTANPLADILKLAMDSGDLTVSQLASQANKQQSLVEGQATSLRDQLKKQLSND